MSTSVSSTPSPPSVPGSMIMTPHQTRAVSVDAGPNAATFASLVHPLPARLPDPDAPDMRFAIMMDYQRMIRSPTDENQTQRFYHHLLAYSLFKPVDLTRTIPPEVAIVCPWDFSNLRVDGMSHWQTSPQQEAVRLRMEGRWRLPLDDDPQVVALAPTPRYTLGGNWGVRRPDFAVCASTSSSLPAREPPSTTQLPGQSQHDNKPWAISSLVGDYKGQRFPVFSLLCQVIAYAMTMYYSAGTFLALAIQHTTFARVVVLRSDLIAIELPGPVRANIDEHSESDALGNSVVVKLTDLEQAALTLPWDIHHTPVTFKQENLDILTSFMALAGNLLLPLSMEASLTHLKRPETPSGSALQALADTSVDIIVDAAANTRIAEVLRRPESSASAKRPRDDPDEQGEGGSTPGQQHARNTAEGSRDKDASHRRVSAVQGKEAHHTSSRDGPTVRDRASIADEAGRIDDDSRDMRMEVVPLSESVMRYWESLGESKDNRPTGYSEDGLDGSTSSGPDLPEVPTVVVLHQLQVDFPDLRVILVSPKTMTRLVKETAMALDQRIVGPTTAAATSTANDKHTETSIDTMDTFPRYVA